MLANKKGERQKKGFVFTWHERKTPVIFFFTKMRILCPQLYRRAMPNSLTCILYSCVLGEKDGMVKSGKKVLLEAHSCLC